MKRIEPSGKPRRIAPANGNIFLDLGFPPEKALALLFKTRILSSILSQVKRKRYTQKQLVGILQEHQPVVSNLLCGRISQMSIERLLAYAFRLGLGFEVQEKRGRRRAA